MDHISFYAVDAQVTGVIFHENYQMKYLILISLFLSQVSLAKDDAHPITANRARKLGKIAKEKMNASWIAWQINHTWIAINSDTLGGQQESIMNDEYCSQIKNLIPDIEKRGFKLIQGPITENCSDCVKHTYCTISWAIK